MKNIPLLQRSFRYRYENAVIVLIVINLAVYLLNSFFPMSRLYISLIPLAVVDRLWIWQPFTYMFAHGNFFHLFFNMFGLFIFGTPLERRLGTYEFLLFYLLTGFLVGLFCLVVYGAMSPLTPILGASGAVYAILFAYAVFFPDNLLFIWGIIPLKAYMAVLLFIGIEVFSQITRSSSGIAHLAHLAGVAFAFLYIYVRYQRNPLKSFFHGRH